MGDLTPAPKILCGIVCGMISEVRALGRWADDPRIAVAVSGARPDRAEAAARRLVAEGCRVLLSWGVAGGLDPALAPGEVVIPREVVAEDGARFPLSDTVIARLDRAIQTGEMPRSSRGRAGSGAILGLDNMVRTVAEKADLYQRTGAVAVDMESHRVALAAAAAGLPFLAVRAIGDPAGRTLPALAARALGEDGRPRIGPVVAGLLRRPGDLAALLRVKQDTDAALAALTGVADGTVPAMLEGL